jgi:hypothetical protein
MMPGFILGRFWLRFQPVTQAGRNFLGSRS